jgi:hypothetical protein
MKKSTLLLLLVAASQLGATDCGQIITDRGFDLWCGDQLCYWKLERGEIEKVPTWIDGDDGVSMLGDDVAIAQMTTVTSNDDDCIEFHLVADIEESAEVTLEADIFGDGTIDWSERLPSSDWERLSLRIGIEGSYQGILFRITKRGSGTAVLAGIGAETADDCPSFTPVVSRPNGALCGGDVDCDSGHCDGVCAECREDLDCTGGEICGTEQHAPGNLLAWNACVAPASALLGELCHRPDECTTGLCFENRCIACSDGSQCAGGACAEALETGIFECDPGGNDGVPGSVCVLDEDCASGSCDGIPIGTCDDDLLDRPCHADAECPPYADLRPRTCTFVAVAGGTCQ